MHKLLERQLRRHFGSLEAVPAELWPFLETVDATYAGNDEDRKLIERSMEISSEELVSRNVALSQSEAELRDANRALEELNRFRTQFISNAAHELGTPLTPIKIQLHLLKRALSEKIEVTEAQRRSLQTLDRNLERLASLVKDVLDSAKLQSDRLTLRVESVDVARSLRETFDALQGVADEAGILLQLDAPPVVHARTDARRIDQVLMNLVNNALKFTPRGGLVKVGARVDDDRVVVSVADSGAGIKPEDIARLFRPFSQVHDIAENPKGGTGLGLYICKGIVEASGGRIWCESKGLGQGTTFPFELPLAPAPDAVAPERR